MYKGTLSVMCSILIVVMLCIAASGQEYWAVRIGASGSEWAYSVKQTIDGGFVMVGPTTSFGASGYDVWVVKLDQSANIMWQKVYGGSSDEIPNAIQQTSDGGYIIAGRTNSYGIGGLDFFVLRLNAVGDFLWFKTYGGSGDEYAYEINEVVGGGFVLFGSTTSAGAGNLDYCVMRLDEVGTVLWQRVYGGSGIDMSYKGKYTADGGFIVVGGVTSFGAGGYDVWVLKLDASGNIIWQKAFGGTSDDLAFSVEQTNDSGYIIAGRTSSFGAGGIDFWILKLDSMGNLVWQHTYGGASTDWGFGVRQTNEGNFIVAGRTDSFGSGNSDYWILKLNAVGDIVWQKAYGGSNLDYSYAVELTADGSYIVTGVNASYSAGGYDILTLKLDALGNVGSDCYLMKLTNVVPTTPQYSVLNTNVIPVVSGLQFTSVIPTYIQPNATISTLCSFFSIPGEVKNTLYVSKSSGDIELRWDPPGGSCDALYYGIYRGNLPLPSYNHTYLQCAITSLTYLDETALANHYYLVVPLNLVREGSYGTSFDGSGLVERPVGSPECMQQLLIPCN